VLQKLCASVVPQRVQVGSGAATIARVTSGSVATHHRSWNAGIRFTIQASAAQALFGHARRSQSTSFV